MPQWEALHTRELAVGVVALAARMGVIGPAVAGDAGGDLVAWGWSCGARFSEVDIVVVPIWGDARDGVVDSRPGF